MKWKLLATLLAAFLATGCGGSGNTEERIDHLYEITEEQIVFTNNTRAAFLQLRDIVMEQSAEIARLKCEVHGECPDE